VWIHGGRTARTTTPSSCRATDRRSSGSCSRPTGTRARRQLSRSTGRGAQFARSILADWGHKEVEDLLAGVDYAVGNGIADPARLGSRLELGGLLTGLPDRE